jgi:hypothetical protein
MCLVWGDCVSETRKTDSSEAIAISDENEKYVTETAPRGTPSELTLGQPGSAQRMIAWSSFFFALLQSVCTFFATVNGFRRVIGLSSLVVSAGVRTDIGRWHQNWIRLSMLGLALLGSLFNLTALMQVRRLRNRPASRWRQRPLSPHQIRMEQIQLVLSFAALVLIGLEEYLHFHMRGHL